MPGQRLPTAHQALGCFHLIRVDSALQCVRNNDVTGHATLKKLGAPLCCPSSPSSTEVDGGRLRTPDKTRRWQPSKVVPRLYFRDRLDDWRRDPAGDVTVDNVRGAARLRLRLHLKGPWKSSSTLGTPHRVQPLGRQCCQSTETSTDSSAEGKPQTFRGMAPTSCHFSSSGPRRGATASWVIESLRTVYLRVSNVGPSS